MVANKIEKTTKIPMRYGFGIGLHGKTSKKTKGSGSEPIFLKNLRAGTSIPEKLSLSFSERVNAARLLEAPKANRLCYLDSHQAQPNSIGDSHPGR